MKLIKQPLLFNMNPVSKTIAEKPWARWLVLVLIGFTISVNYYFYDTLSPLKPILQKTLNFNSTDFGWLSSAYSIPNTFLFMSIIGGAILDKIGIRRTGLGFISFMVLGAFLTAYGASDYFRNGGLFFNALNSFWPTASPEFKMMLLGRVFFGLGAETSIVLASKVIVKWFKGKFLALAFGLKIGFGRLGTVAALNLTPGLTQNETSVNLALWVATILLLIGLLAFIIYSVMDVKFDKEQNIKASKDSSEVEKFKLNDLLKLLGNKSFLFVALLCVTFYSAAFPFMQYAPDFFYNKFGLSLQESSSITSIMPFATAIVTPIIGFFVDKKGKNITLMIFGSLIISVVHLSFALTYLPPYAGMILLGIAFSLVPAAMWPTVVKLVDEKRIGSAYGLMYSIQNIGLWGFPILAGIILDKTNKPDSEVLNYTWTMIMFAFLGIFGLIFSLLLKKADKKDGYRIDNPTITN